MLDNVTLKIEEMKVEHGSYIDAMLAFSKEFEIYDFEDILEVLHPNLRGKIKQEFIDKNHIPSLKRNTMLDFMRS